VSANRRRGEVAVELDGREWRLCLTLNALAELEDAFAADDLGGLMARFGSGRLGARDLKRILGAGLRGGGADISDEAAGAMGCAGGATGLARAVAELLEATFGGAVVSARARGDVSADGGAASANP
jgi:hypothetical protein